MKTKSIAIVILAALLVAAVIIGGILFQKWTISEDELDKWVFEEGATAVIDNTSVVTVRDDWMVFDDITFVISGGKSSKKFVEIKEELGRILFSRYGELSKVVYTQVARTDDGVTYYVINNGGKVCCICQPQTSTTATEPVSVG